MTSEVKIISIFAIITMVVIAGGLALTKGGPKTVELNLNPDILVREENPRMTGAEAKIKIVEFADFACPACAMLSPNLKTALDKHKNNIDFAFRIIPIHGQVSYDSAIAAFAAGEQNKFFEMADILYANQTKWSGSKDNRDTFIAYAKELNLDITKFTASIDSKEFQSKVKSIVDKDNADATTMKVSSTPTLFIGSTPVIGVQSAEELDQMIAAEIAKATGQAVPDSAEESTESQAAKSPATVNQSRIDASSQINLGQ